MSSDKKEENKKLPFHELFIKMMTSDENIISEMVGIKGPCGYMPAMKGYCDDIQVRVAAGLLALGHVPEKAIPAIKEAALIVLKKEGDDEDVRAALKNLAEELGIELPEEEGDKEQGG